jgi:hypothetical protein
MDKASGPLTLVKNVRDSAEFFMTAGPRASHSSDQRVGVSSPSGRAEYQTNGLGIDFL